MSYVLQVSVLVRPDSVDRYMALLMDNAQATRGEHGCERFEVFVDPDEPTRLMLLEIYRDEEAFAEHLRSAHFARYTREAVPLIMTRERKSWHRV